MLQVTLTDETTLKQVTVVEATELKRERMTCGSKKRRKGVEVALRVKKMGRGPGLNGN